LRLIPVAKKKEKEEKKMKEEKKEKKVRAQKAQKGPTRSLTNVPMTPTLLLGMVVCT
jgi:hypothetical protein